MKSSVERILLGSVIFIAALLLTAVVLFSGRMNETVTLAPINLIGEYSVDGGEWHPLTPDTVFDTEDIHTTVIRGRLSEAVPEDQGLILYIRNLYVTLKIDGITVWKNAAPAGRNFFPTPGIKIAEVYTGGIPADKEVEFIFTGTFRNVVSSIPDLLGNMYVGSRALLYEHFMRAASPAVFGSISVIIIGMLMLILELIVKLLKINYVSKLAALGFFTMMAGAWFLFSTDSIQLPLVVLHPRAASVCNILSLYLMSAAGITLVRTFISRSYARIGMIPAVLLYFSQAILYALQLCGIVQLYEVQILALVFTLLVLAEYVILVVDSIKSGKKDSRLAAACFIPAIAGSLLECVNFYIFPFMKSYFISTGGFVCTFVLLLLLIIYMMKRSNDAVIRANAMEKEYAENRIAIMISQIQPHFLYNVLSEVEYLCGTDPDKAKEAVASFSRYLRGNMRALTKKEPIPFSLELEHTNYYLTLEKMRFEEKLNIIMDIGPRYFFLPALSLQPIVENAVKHGVTCRKQGGTVTIRTQETDDAWLVTVCDDGVGFDPEHSELNGRNHYGLSNVRSRLASICGGTLRVESRPGKGTTVIMSIPKEVA